MTTEVRAALIGYGLGGRIFHAPFLRAVDGFSLNAIVTSDAERTAQAIADTGVRVLPSADALWAEADSFDLVVISTGNAAHVEQAEAALDRGLHVVVDKPLCADAATAQHLAERARAAGRLLVTFQNRRFDGDFLTLQQLVSDGSLGTLHRVESRFERWRPEPKGGWRESADPADLGGLLYDLGSHVIDQALVLLGPAESVYAEVGTRRPGALVDDDTFVAITHVGGDRKSVV
jgi:predicted dehydrogenase